VDSNSAPSKKTLIKYQNELLKKTTKSQLRATKIVKEVVKKSPYACIGAELTK
jgi:hypothetical protein